MSKTENFLGTIFSGHSLSPNILDVSISESSLSQQLGIKAGVLSLLLVAKPFLVEFFSIVNSCWLIIPIKQTCTEQTYPISSGQYDSLTKDCSSDIVERCYFPSWATATTGVLLRLWFALARYETQVVLPSIAKASPPRCSQPTCRPVEKLFVATFFFLFARLWETESFCRLNETVHWQYASC